MNSLEIVELQIEDVIPNSKNGKIYRGLTDSNGNIVLDQVRDLVASMSKLGQKEPIVVVKDGNKYKIISGNRRHAVARLLKFDKIKAVVIPNLTSDEEDALIVTHNLTREKSLKEKLAEFDIYKDKIFRMKEDNDKVNWVIEKDEHSGREEITINDLVATILNMGTTKAQQLLYIKNQNRDDLIDEIDAGQLTVHSAYRFLKDKEKNDTVSLAPHLSAPNFELMYDSDRSYADTIVNTFREKIKIAKKSDKFSLVKLLKEAIELHEDGLSAEFDKQLKYTNELFTQIDKALQDNKFSVYDFDESRKMKISVNIENLEDEIGVHREKSNGRYNRDSLLELRKHVLRGLFNPNDFPYIVIDSISVNKKSYSLFKDDVYDYFLLFSNRYMLSKQIKDALIKPSERKKINRSIATIDKSIWIFLRILRKVSKPFAPQLSVKSKTPKTTRK